MYMLRYATEARCLRVSLFVRHVQNGLMCHRSFYTKFYPNHCSSVTPNTIADAQKVIVSEDYERIFVNHHYGASRGLSATADLLFAVIFKLFERLITQLV